jgi:hypothetical protein
MAPKMSLEEVFKQFDASISVALSLAGWRVRCLKMYSHDLFIITLCKQTPSQNAVALKAK